MPTDYFIQIEQRGIEACVDANDCPIVRNTVEDEGTGTEKINPWIVPGRNTLRVRLTWPEHFAFSPGIARFRLRLLAVEHNAAPTAPQRLLGEFAWPRDEPEEYPVETVLQFDVADAPPSTLWKNAERVAITPESRAAITELVTNLHGCCVRRDATELQRKLDYKAVDLGRTWYMDPTAARQSQGEFLSFMVEDPENPMMPIEADELDMQVVGRGRIVWVTRKDGEPPLSTQGNPCVSIPLFVGRIAGKWTVVR